MWKPTGGTSLEKTELILRSVPSSF